MVPSMLSLALIFSNQFLPTPPQGRNESLVTCVTTCHQTPSCASFFYNFDAGLCHHSFYLYSIVKYGDTLTPTADNVKYFEWTLGSCNNVTGWKYHKPSKFCFKYYDYDRKQGEAKTECEAENATLVKANDSPRLHFIYHFGFTYDRDIWTNGQFDGSVWLWRSGEEFTSSTSWISGHPRSGDDCVVIKKDTEACFSEPCTKRKRFMCQLEDLNTDLCSLNVKAIRYV